MGDNEQSESLVSGKRLGQIIQEFMNSDQNWFDTQLLFGGMTIGKFLISSKNTYVTSNQQNFFFVFTSEERLAKCEGPITEIFKDYKWVDFQGLLNVFNDEDIDAFLFDYETSNFPLSKESYKRIFVPRYKVLRANIENQKLEDEYKNKISIPSKIAEKITFLVPSAVTQSEEKKSIFSFYTVRNQETNAVGIPVFSNLQLLRNWAYEKTAGGQDWLNDHGTVVPFSLAALREEITNNHYQVDIFVIDLLTRAQNIIPF